MSSGLTQRRRPATQDTFNDDNLGPASSPSNAPIPEDTDNSKSDNHYSENYDDDDGDGKGRNN
ncbi:hypothetical protein HDV05_000201, partial [Chytridiales sp. JEL 0842]